MYHLRFQAQLALSGSIISSTYPKMEGRYTPKHFVISVYGVLLLQLVFTYGVMVAMTESTSVHTSVLHYAIYLFPLMWTVAFNILFAFLIFNVKYVIKMVLFCVFTLCMAIIMGCIHIHLIHHGGHESMLLAIQLTLMTFCALSLLVWVVPLDHTNMFIIEQVSGASLYALIFWGVYSTSVNQFLFNSIGTSVFVSYIVIDTWRLGCTHNKKDVLLSALELYLDILNMVQFVTDVLLNNEKE